MKNTPAASAVILIARGIAVVGERASLPNVAALSNPTNEKIANTTAWIAFPGSTPDSVSCLVSTLNPCPASTETVTNRMITTEIASSVSPTRDDSRISRIASSSANPVTMA